MCGEKRSETTAASSDLHKRTRSILKPLVSLKCLIDKLLNLAKKEIIRMIDYRIEKLNKKSLKLKNFKSKIEGR